MTWSTSHRHNPATPHRLGRETPSNKTPRWVVAAPGALLVLTALAVLFASPSHAGLYPAGEGAGFAGGIVSAAIDGLRCADAILQLLS